MNRFTQKVAGLPAWTWGLIIGLVVVAAMYWMRSKQAATTAAPAIIDAYPGISDVGVPVSSGSSSSTPASSTYETNGGWQANSLAYLISTGASPLGAQQALAIYLDGQPLTPAQAELVNRALSHNGPPPQGTSGTSSIETPTTPTTPTKAARGKPIGYVRQKGTTAVYALYSDYTRQWLDAVEYAAMGRPKYTDYPKGDPIWSRYKVTGSDAPAPFAAK